MKPIQPSQEMLRKLHVITVISNPVRFHSRYELYNNFKRHMEASGAQLWTVEVAFGERPFEITKGGCESREIQFRSLDEIWNKEAALSLALSRLPLDWGYVAFVDADIMFHNPYWLTETVQKLQHFHVVQMFAEAVDLGPKHEIIQRHRGFVKGYFDEGFKFPNKYRNKKDYCGGYGRNGSFAHPGWAWAYTREALEHLGGLIDFAIAGSGDHSMACALIGEAERTFPGQIHSRYAQKILRWQDRALKYIKRDIGYVDGTISHFWHGAKKNRKYTERWSILLDNNFDPDLDLKRDTQGLYVWTDNNYKLRDAMRAYFAERSEDSIDL